MPTFSEKLDNLIGTYKSAENKKKVLYIAAVVAIFLIVLFVCLYILGSLNAFIAGLRKDDAEIHSALWYGFHDYFFLALLLTIVVMGLILVLFLKTGFTNSPRYYDKERGIWVMRDDTMGGQRYLTHDEMEYEFEIGNIRDVNAPIFGQISNNGEQVIGWKKRVDGPSGNQNVLCIAPMGTGKTFGPVRVNLLQAVRRGESFVCTDPKGELYNSLSEYCRKAGMNVHVLNLAEPRYSEFWNVLEETIDPETERLDSTRLNDFANIYMKNSGDSDHEDFWYGCALNLVKAVLGYAAYNHETEIINNYILLYQTITGKVDDINIRKMRNTMISFPSCREIIRSAANDAGLDMNEIEDKIHKIDTIFKNEYSLSVVFETMLDFDKISDEMENIPNWHPAKTAYRMFKTNDSDSVRKSAIQGAQLRFQIFGDEKLKEVLSHDGLHCSDITDKHSAYFIILSDKTETTKPIASLFFSFLFKDVMDAWDKAQSMADARGEKNPRRPLTVMLDEFYSVGIIGGNPRAFGTTMSTSRSREIHIWVILQSYSQLAALYGPDTGNMIQSGCSTILYLGGNDPATTEFIRSFVAGTATILTESHSEATGLLGGTNGSNLSVTGRDFITGEEAKRWRDDVLIAKQATYLAKGKSFPWIQHPAYKLCTNTSVYDQVLPVETRVIEINKEKAQISDPETYIRGEIKQLAVGTAFEADFKPNSDMLTTGMDTLSSQGKKPQETPENASQSESLEGMNRFARRRAQRAAALERAKNEGGLDSESVSSGQPRSASRTNRNSIKTK